MAKTQSNIWSRKGFDEFVREVRTCFFLCDLVGVVSLHIYKEAKKRESYNASSPTSQSPYRYVIGNQKWENLLVTQGLYN